MLLNKLPPAFDVFAHQDAEHPLGLGGLGQGDAEQGSHGWIERGFPELVAVHFTQAFETLHLHPALADCQHGRQNLGDTCHIVDVAFVDQGIARAQLFAADGFFLGQVIVVDRQAEFDELGEKPFQLLDLVEFVVLLEAARTLVDGLPFDEALPFGFAAAAAG